MKINHILYEDYQNIQDVCHFKIRCSLFYDGLMLQSDLVHLSIFRGLSDDQFNAIKSVLELCSINKGFIIFEQQQTTSYFYILLKGEVIIKFKPYDGPAITVAHINPGDVFGWSAALGKDTYTSTAMTIDDIKAFRLDRHDMQMLRKNYPDVCEVFLERLSNVIAERVRNTHSEVFSILNNSIGINAQMIEEL
jgi:CRP/FNR family cyclic AMP-dependent transcriptional regulator